MYHKLSIEETLARLDVNTETGLSDEEAAARIAQDETLVESSSFIKFAAKGIARPIVLILFVSALLIGVFGNFFEALLILAVIVIHTLFSAACARRGEKSLAESISTSVTHAIVLRNGAKMKIASNELVVGDIVTIKPGRVVPADLRLITSEGLVIDESALTGRGRVEKNCEDRCIGDLSLEFRDNCAFEGTIVLEGRADGIVTATGYSTEMSRLTLPMDAPQKDKTPTFSRISKLSRRLAIIASIVCFAVFVISLIYRQPFLSSLVASLALAVAIIPEGLSSAALTAFSDGTDKLRRSGFSVKSMRDAEMLGEVKVFVTDIPQMGVAATYTNGRIHTPQEESTVPFLEGLLLCELKNPSLSSFASRKCDSERVRAAFPKIGEFMGEVTTTLLRAEDTTISYTGGDPREILSRSSLIWDFGRIRTLTGSDREEIEEVIDAFEDEGYSIYALGLRSGDDVPTDSDLIFLGIAATRAEVTEASTPDTSALIDTGVQVYLLTESDAGKARLGAAALSLPAENIICGRELGGMTDSELCESLGSTFVFASLRPQDKVRIINVMKNSGSVVAAIGDSLADAPALDASDVGMSDIHAQDAAKDASGVILRGESGADEAIVRGKILRTNIRRAVTYLAAANTAELLAVLISVALGFGFPVAPWQILAINLITDTFPALLLARGNHLQRRNTRFAYIWGIVLGLIIPAAFKIISGLYSAELAQWAVFAGLTVGEIALALPMYYMGRKR